MTTGKPLAFLNASLTAIIKIHPQKTSRPVAGVKTQAVKPKGYCSLAEPSRHSELQICPVGVDVSEYLLKRFNTFRRHSAPA